jgi:hypothetical protein
MAATRTSWPLRAFNWLSGTTPGLACSTAGVLCLVGIEVCAYWQTGKVMYVGFAIFMLALIVKGWVQVYRHRDDPSWPPRLEWVLRDRAE